MDQVDLDAKRLLPPLLTPVVHSLPQFLEKPGKNEKKKWKGNVSTVHSFVHGNQRVPRSGEAEDPPTAGLRASKKKTRKEETYPFQLFVRKDH